MSLASKIAIALLVVSAYVLASLWPFSWSPPRLVENGARVTAAGLHFISPGLLRTETPPRWLEPARRTHRLGITARLRALSTLQLRRPMTILTVSPDSHERDLELEQQGRALVLHVRARGARPGRGSRDVVLGMADVFDEGRWVDVAIEVMPGAVVLRLGDDREKRREVSAEPLGGWNTSYRLALGNQVSGAHPWLGEIENLVVRTPETTDRYPDSVALAKPRHFWIFNTEPRLRPFHRFSQRDAIENLLLYLPVGFLLGLLSSRGGWRGPLMAVLLTGALSITMEMGQLFIGPRNPSVTDSILNIVSGAIGYVPGRVVRRLTASLWPART